MSTEETPHQRLNRYGVSDRKGQLRDPRPSHQKLLPRDVSCVNIVKSFGSHRGCRHADSPYSQGISPDAERFDRRSH